MDVSAENALNIVERPHKCPGASRDLQFVMSQQVHRMQTQLLFIIVLKPPLHPPQSAPPRTDAPQLSACRLSSVPSIKRTPVWLRWPAFESVRGGCGPDPGGDPHTGNPLKPPNSRTHKCPPPQCQKVQQSASAKQSHVAY